MGALPAASGVSTWRAVGCALTLMLFCTAGLTSVSPAIWPRATVDTQEVYICVCVCVCVDIYHRNTDPRLLTQQKCLQEEEIASAVTIRHRVQHFWGVRISFGSWETLARHLRDDCVAVDAGHTVAEGSNLHASFVVEGTIVANCTTITAIVRPFPLLEPTRDLWHTRMACRCRCCQDQPADHCQQSLLGREFTGSLGL